MICKYINLVNKSKIETILFPSRFYHYEVGSVLPFRVQNAAYVRHSESALDCYGSSSGYGTEACPQDTVDVNSNIYTVQVYPKYNWFVAWSSGIADCYIRKLPWPSIFPEDCNTCINVAFTKTSFGDIFEL